jgi:adenylate cyclase
VVDLGSANGTYVNHRRVHTMQLHDGDVLTIGASLVTFHSAGSTELEPGALEETLHDVQQVRAWLFITDILDSTGIVQRLGPQEMADAFAQWMAGCRKILDATGGVIDKELGDGWFGFWPAAERSAKEVAAALAEFQRFQAESKLPFRMVLHLGTAFTGGQVASGTYRLFGPDVNFIFRMEGVAKTIATRCLLSQATGDALAPYMAVQPAGSYPVRGLEGSYTFFQL